VETLKYAEASVLLVDGKVFETLGMFDERLQWAMCEDADLSLRAQQLGYGLHWLEMPHQHWRSTSINSLPTTVRSSILEHNRARLFASWSQTLATGRIGQLEVFDLCSDGLGDVFCVLPHLRAWLGTLPAARRTHTVINTNHPELMEFLGGTGVRITSEREEGALLSLLDSEGVTAVHSIRQVNYSLPLNLHSLLCGALGLPMCGTKGYLAFRESLRDSSDGSTRTRLPAHYCAVHFEFVRDHHGRALAPASIKSILGQCRSLFETFVLVGQERRLVADRGDGDKARVIDLQGKLSVRELVHVIGGAEYFVGIDSLPAHVAQACGVRSAIFFGAVHPLARIWDEGLVWPLVAELDCLGCYHTHLESSVPYCMRRDQACAAGPDSKVSEQILLAMRAGERYPWATHRHRFEALQATLFHLLRHHPSPPERLMRPIANGNELVSLLAHRILDQAADLAGNRYRSTTIRELTERLHVLEAQVFEREVQLDQMRQRVSSDRTGPLTQPASKPADNLAQLAHLPLLTHRCSVSTNAQWLEVTADEEDPQLHLPPIAGNGGEVWLSLASVADRADTLEVYWATNDAPFNDAQKRSIPIGPEPRSAHVSLDVPASDRVRLRIDPLRGAGRVRLQGALSGVAVIDERDAPSPTRRGTSSSRAPSGSTNGRGRRPAVAFGRKDSSHRRPVAVEG
jgi:hypothetical protein